MKNEFTAYVEKGEDWWIAQCPEIPEANGQGRTPEEALDDLRAAIELVLEYRRERGDETASPGAVKQTVAIG